MSAHGWHITERYRSMMDGIKSPHPVSPVAAPQANAAEDRVPASVSVIVPCFNEEASLPTLRDRLLPVLGTLSQRFSVDLVMVDDGSRDGTLGILRRDFTDITGIRSQVICHDTNRGISHAMASGFTAARGEIVCTLDSDCTYAPEELPRMIDLLVSSNADIVTGSPYHPDGQVEGVEGWRLMLSKGASWGYSFIVPARLHCYTSLFRAYRRDWARPELFKSNGYLGVTEILVTASWRGAEIVEFPVTLSCRVHGQSKMRVARVLLSHLRLMRSLLFSHNWELHGKGEMMSASDGNECHGHSLSLH